MADNVRTSFCGNPPHPLQGHGRFVVCAKLDHWKPHTPLSLPVAPENITFWLWHNVSNQIFCWNLPLGKFSCQRLILLVWQMSQHNHAKGHKTSRGQRSLLKRTRHHVWVNLWGCDRFVCWARKLPMLGKQDRSTRKIMLVCTQRHCGWGSIDRFCPSWDLFDHECMKSYWLIVTFCNTWTPGRKKIVCKIADNCLCTGVVASVDHCSEKVQNLKTFCGAL